MTDHGVVPCRESLDVFVLNEERSCWSRVHGIGDSSRIRVMDFPFVHIRVQRIVDRSYKAMLIH